MKLVNPVDLKTFLGVETTNQDAVLDMFNDLVSSRIESWLNRTLKKDKYDQFFNSGRRHYYLPAYPIDTTETLTVTYSGSEQTLNSDYFVWENEGLIEFYVEPAYIQPKEIEIAWTGGYEEVTSGGNAYLTGLPDAIVLAAMIQIAFSFRRRKDIGLVSVSMPDGSITKNAPLKLLEEVKEILSPYRRAPMVR